MRVLAFAAAFLFTAGLLGCSSESLPLEDDTALEVESSFAAASKKPLEGTWYADFSEGYSTLTFDGVEYIDYGENVGTGKPFEDVLRGRAWFWEESHELYNTSGDLLLVYTFTGYMTHKWKWHANGSISEAYGEFAMWQGRHIDGMGTITFKTDGTPIATGHVRLH